MTFFIRVADNPDQVERIENVIAFDKWQYDNDTWFITSFPLREFPGMFSREIVIRENVISIEVNDVEWKPANKEQEESRFVRTGPQAQ